MGNGRPPNRPKGGLAKSLVVAQPRVRGFQQLEYGGANFAEAVRPAEDRPRGERERFELGQEAFLAKNVDVQRVIADRDGVEDLRRTVFMVVRHDSHREILDREVRIGIDVDPRSRGSGNDEAAHALKLPYRLGSGHLGPYVPD